MKPVALLALFVLSLPASGAYEGYRSVTFDHTRSGASDQTNFTALVSGAYNDMATVVNGGKVHNTVSCGVNSITCPADLVVASDAACTVLLSWEIETYNAATGAILMWINVPTLSHSTNTSVYLCYGNPFVTTFQGGSIGAAYDSYTQFAGHFPDGTTLSAKDSSANPLCQHD
jgi:hypothetical protein